MKTALALDIDNTLTPPRLPLEKEMADILNRLRVPFFLAAGSHLSLLQEQFFYPLYQFGFRKQYDAFVSNGAIHYHCDYSSKMSIELVSKFEIREHLGETDYKFLIEKVTEVLDMKEYPLEHSLKVSEGRVVDRVSMVNLCPIGRKNQEGTDDRRNRENFVSFDQATGYRGKVLRHLNQELSTLIKTKNLKITLGGQTSFDIGVVGEDKTKPVRTLLERGFERVIFIGDALFEGGNDAAIADFIRTWPSGSKCPVEAIQVNSRSETIDMLHKLQFLD